MNSKLSTVDSLFILLPELRHFGKVIPEHYFTSKNGRPRRFVFLSNLSSNDVFKGTNGISFIGIFKEKDDSNNMVFFHDGLDDSSGYECHLGSALLFSEQEFLFIFGEIGSHVELLNRIKRGDQMAVMVFARLSHRHIDIDKIFNNPNIRGLVEFLKMNPY